MRATRPACPLRPPAPPRPARGPSALPPLHRPPSRARRLGNLERLAAHGAPLWKAHLSTLDAAAASFSRAQEEVDAQIEAVNRKRKSDQLAAGPRLVHLESQWVAAVKKNLEIEAQCLRLEATCAQLKEAVEAKRQAR